MMQERILQLDTAIASSTENSDKNANWNVLKDNREDIFSSGKKIDESFSLLSSQFSVFKDPNEPTTTLLNCNELNKFSNDQENFLKMCKQKLGRNELPVDFDRWTMEQQHDYLMDNIDKYFSNIPESLRFILPAIFKDGDCGRPISDRPDWLDMDKFRRGQAFTRRNLSGISLAQIVSLFVIFGFTNGLKTLIMSQKSNTPYRAFKRYLSTYVHINHWMESNPWKEGTQAHCAMQRVRKMHLTMRRRLCSCSDEQIDALSRISDPYCPMYKAIKEDFKGACSAVKDFQCPFTITRVKALNQGDMSCTQCAFISLTVLQPDKFGIHDVCDEDLEAFCHMWRGIGYLLGIEDRYNFCRGSLQDVRKRTMDVYTQWIIPNSQMLLPENEHMIICVYKGLSFILPLMSYRIFLLYVCSIFELNMSRLYGSLSFVERMLYVGLNFVLNYLMKLPIVVTLLNALVRRNLNSAMNFGPEKHSELRKQSHKFNKWWKLNKNNLQNIRI